MKIATNILAVLVLGAASSSAFAVLIPWTGTADYTVAPGAAGDEDKVGLFSTYNFAANSPLLIKALGSANPFNPVVGDEFQVFYQSFVSGHQNLNGLGVLSPALNTTGAGSGYELTVATSFKEVITGISGGNLTVDITGGDTKLYFDTSPDYNFAADTGFTNDNIILSGTIINGSTVFTNGTSGVTNLNVRIDSYDAAVFEPDTIVAGSSIFSLGFDPAGNSRGISSVLGNSYNSSTDLLLVANGNFALAVPEASSYVMMLMGIGMMGFMVARRRNILS